MPETRYIVGDVFDVLAKLPDASVDLVMTSPPFLALRSYLPADHPDKSKEIGSEATPAEFIDTLLDVVEECARVLTPHGSLVFELGDKYAESGGAGGDYNDDGLRAGQPRFGHVPTGEGWPLGKSLCFVPQLFGASLAYGRNLLRPERTTEPWRVRNYIAWCRPNPPVGSLSDKCRPATSYLTVATKARDRWFDMDSVRVPSRGRAVDGNNIKGADERSIRFAQRVDSNPAGAPLLDWWEIPTQPYSGSHYATFPDELARRVILLMCPTKVCLECGKPSRRITQLDGYTDHNGVLHPEGEKWSSGISNGGGAHSNKPGSRTTTTTTVGWTDCLHGAFRPGLVLDPFAGSGTTLAMAQGNGRSSIGIDLDDRNADLALDRVGPLYMTVESEALDRLLPAGDFLFKPKP
jgi:DNA modification methylase